MSQLLTLFWLRFLILRNSMTGRREVVSTIIRFLFLIVYLFLSVAAGLALFAVMVLLPDSMGNILANSLGTLFGLLILLTLITQATGTSANFDPRRYLLFPISFKKLYALNLVSALSEPVMITVLPSVAGILIGRAVALHDTTAGLFAFACAALWIDSLFVLIALLTAWLLSGRKRQTEIFFTILIGAVLISVQIFPRLIEAGYGEGLWRHLGPYQSAINEALSWTPFGIWKTYFDLLKYRGPAAAVQRLLPVILLWTGVVQFAGFLIFKRLAVSAPSGTSRRDHETDVSTQSGWLGFQLPFGSEQLSAVVAKELAYLTRNTMTWLNTVNALIVSLVFARPMQTMQSSEFIPDQALPQQPLPFSGNSLRSEIWWLLIVTGWAFIINFQHFSAIFAFDGSGFRQYLLAPANWKRLILGKNLAVWTMVIFQLVLIVIGSSLVYGNVTLERLSQVICVTIISLAVFSITGNYLSLHFPYALEFGVRRRRSQEGYGTIMLFASLGVVLGNGLIIVLAALPGWLLNKPWVSFLSFGLVAGLALLIYTVCLEQQGSTLERKRFDISEALTRKQEKL